MPSNKKPIDTAEIVRLRDEGWSYEEIGKRFGIVKSTVSKRIKGYEKEKLQEGLPKLPQLEVKKNPLSIEKALQAIHDLEKRIGAVDKHIKSSSKQDKIKWEKVRTRLLTEKRRWLSFGSDLEYQMSQHYQIKEILHCIMEEIGRESKELQKRILSRLESL